jgi:KinB signaling pathway activation protein
MKSRGLVRFFFSILAVGALITSVSHLADHTENHAYPDKPDQNGENLTGLKIQKEPLVLPLLTVHRFALEILRSSSLWNLLQLFIILFVAFDLMLITLKIMPTPINQIRTEKI